MIDRLLIVVPDFPCPPIAGSHLRNLQQICLISDLGIKPSVLSFLARDSSPPYQFDMLNGRVRDVTTVKLVVPQESVVKTKVVRNLRYLLPLRSVRHGYEKGIYPAAIRYDAVDGGERILRLIKALEVDAVWLRSYFVHYLPMIRSLGVKAIVDAHDCDSYMAFEIVRAQRNPVLKLSALCAYVATRRQERRYLPLCDELWETSAEAVTRVKRSVGEALTHVNVFPLPSALDMSRYPLPPGDLEEPDLILTVGSLGWLPNANGAERLITEIFPRVRKLKPSARLCVVGAGASSRLLRAAEKAAGVVMVGFAETLGAYYARAAGVVVAVEEGNGPLLKTLEAMALGKAVVSSVVGVDGIDVVNGEHAVLARTTEEYVEGICRLLERSEERRRLGLNARRLVESRYSWDAARELLRRRSILFAD